MKKSVNKNTKYYLQNQKYTTYHVRLKKTIYVVYACVMY